MSGDTDVWALSEANKYCAKASQRVRDANKRWRKLAYLLCLGALFWPVQCVNNVCHLLCKRDLACVQLLAQRSCTHPHEPCKQHSTG